MALKMEKKLFRLYDVYEDRENLGEFSTITEVKRACRKRDEETDGEWCPLLYKFDKETEKYKRFEEWSYQK